MKDKLKLLHAKESEKSETDSLQKAFMEITQLRKKENEEYNKNNETICGLIMIFNTVKDSNYEKRFWDMLFTVDFR